jgi:hypothetical protein
MEWAEEKHNGRGFWFNTGISGIENTIIQASIKGIRAYKEIKAQGLLK